ncbi:hypothetical protein NE237_027534 [Protea cynaroides]|uniref:Uncharacterized protein n=1 Tax=Protea cynaroides TaxID=273540 RepID=A0A9Q0JT94_9MAGN|nr:hypothetical protein NE237_027534 [Protea cynaroides]
MVSREGRTRNNRNCWDKRAAIEVATDLPKTQLRSMTNGEPQYKGFTNFRRGYGGRIGLLCSEGAHYRGSSEATSRPPNGYPKHLVTTAPRCITATWMAHSFTTSSVMSSFTAEELDPFPHGIEIFCSEVKVAFEWLKSSLSL